MTIYFTADTHFGHANVIKYDKRPFKDVNEMDKQLIARWNTMVNHNDTIYHLGDWTLGDFTKFSNTFKETQGKVYIIIGGHDWRWWSQVGTDLPKNKSGNRPQFFIPNVSMASVTIQHSYLHTDKGYLPIVLNHYSMRSWDRSHYGSWHLYGHHHGRLPGYGKSMDVGVDAWDYYPVSLSQVAEYMSKQHPAEKFSKVKGM